MARVTTFFVILCIVAMGVSLGVIFYTWVGASLNNAISVGLGASALIFLVVSLFSLQFKRSNQRLNDVVRLCEQAMDDVQNVEYRLRMLEEKENSTDSVDDVIGEVEIVSALVKQLAETTAKAEARITELENREGQLAPHAGGEAGEKLESAVQASSAANNVRNLDDERGQRQEWLERRDRVDAINRAVDDERIEVHLQPIVSLPERKVLYYEAFARLRLETGDLCNPEEYSQIDEARDCLAKIDYHLVFRSIQVLRKLIMRNRDLGLYCNLSTYSLSDHGFFDSLSEFLSANTALADNLTFEFSDDAVQSFGALENEHLSALYDYGFRFSIDDLYRLPADLHATRQRGFETLKVNASRLLSDDSPLSTDIHRADIASYILRAEMRLIADGIDNEPQVMELLDHQVSYAQGDHLAPLRVVRADVFSGPGLDPASGSAAAK